MSKPIVAIVGRPNVGKSTLFNRLIRERLSIVEDVPGITRDRIYSDAEWYDKTFTLIDTGGIQSDTEDVISKQMRAQAEMAIAQADAILFVVDSRVGITSEDHEVANILRRTSTPVILVANKVDDPRHLDYDLWNLGIGEPYPVSAIHGTGVADVVEMLLDTLEDAGKFADHGGEEEDRIKVAFIGRPNVGKSSMINRLLNEERSIVSDVAGTTRDSIECPFEYDGKKYTIVDTAGLRKKSKVDFGVEKFSVIRALRAIDKCDVAVTVLDGTQDPAEQDTKIAGYAHDAGKASIFAVNKWDIVERDMQTAIEYEHKIRREFPFMEYAPVVFLSALTGRRVNRLMETIDLCAAEHSKRLSTSMVNQVVEEAVLRMAPAPDKGKEVKVFYATQVSSKPPTFALFSNYPELVHFSYVRYIENCLREAFGFNGTPIKIFLRKRP